MGEVFADSPPSRANSPFLKRLGDYYQMNLNFSEFVLARVGISGIFTLFFQRKHHSPLTRRVRNPPYI